ncbi:hypothetical protein M422DRAFT_242587 [Sphaerobolus stellatus SS14]|nr:hypothetical protein M422DRAFT_242587 [Sphaerobolus stellatus SS14]
MDNKHNTPMQVDPSTQTMSAIQAFKMDPSIEWVIESAPGFVAIKHKMGCFICDALASHCMATKRSYEIRLAEKDVSHAVAEAWPELVRYQDDYYCLLEDYNVLKESVKARYTLYGKDSAWAEQNGYHISDIPASDGKDDNGDLTGLSTIPEDIPQNVPVVPPTNCARPASKHFRNDSKVIHEAGIPAIGGYHLPPKQKRIVTNPPASITGVLPKPLGLHVNVDNANVWYWVNLIKPKYRRAEAEVLLQYFFSSVGRWDQLVTGQSKRNDSHSSVALLLRGTLYPVTRSSIRATSPTGWAVRLRTIWNEVTLHSQLRANEIASLKGGIMNQFHVHDDLISLVRESPFYFSPSMGEPMDQDETDPEPNLIQHPAGSSSLADRLDYGEGGSFSHPPANTHELQARISYYDSLVPQGTARESTTELTEELTHDLYADNLE